MAATQHFDALIIGSGQAGTPLARALAGSGRRTALIERAHVGGTCINEGCTPTKTMVASARVAYLARRGADYGVVTGPVSVDIGRVRSRKRAIVERFRSGVQRRLESTLGLELIFGQTRFVGPRTVEIVGRDGGDARRLSADLVFVNAGARPTRPPLDGGLRLVVHGAGGERVVDGSHLLVAVGRTPNTDTLDCAAADIAIDARCFVKVDNRLETSAPGVYALGDVKGGPQFTHISYDDFRIIRTNLLEGGQATTDGRPVPYTVFMDESRGFMKAVVDTATERVVGVAVPGVEGGELMSVLQLAIMGGVTWRTLRDAIFAHPLLAESLNNLFAEL